MQGFEIKTIIFMKAFLTHLSSNLPEEVAFTLWISCPSV
jgi:hypothetical protein